MKRVFCDICGEELNSEKSKFAWFKLTLQIVSTKSKGCNKELLELAKSQVKNQYTKKGLDINSPWFEATVEKHYKKLLTVDFENLPIINDVCDKCARQIAIDVKELMNRKQPLRERNLGI